MVPRSMPTFLVKTPLMLPLKKQGVEEFDIPPNNRSDNCAKNQQGQ
jgi:hypothetical protein